MSSGIESRDIGPHQIHARRPFAGAVAWALTAELARRYGASATVQPVESHPGDGQYDLLGIFFVPGLAASAYDAASRHMADLDLSSGTARRVGDLHDRRLSWLKPWLERDDPKSTVDELAAFLGLAPIAVLPTTDRRIFGLRLIAGLLGRAAMGRRKLDARMGFLDTSGYGGGVQPALRTFTAAWDAGAATRSDRWWVLRRDPTGALAGVVDLDGRLSGAKTVGVLHDLFPMYQQEKRMEPVLRFATDVLGG